MGEPTKKERLESETDKKSAVLIAQLSWCAHVWNATAKQAAKQIVSDLYQHLSSGGSVSVRVQGIDGEEYTVEVTAN